MNTIEPDKFADIYSKLKEMRTQLDTLVKEYEEIVVAFPKNEEGAPDFAGHRVFHRHEMRKEHNKEESMQALKRNVLTWAVIGILAIIASTVSQVFIHPWIQHIK